MTFDLGLLITAFGFGLRHGIDWDHLAAITDLAGSQTSRQRSMVLSTLYILGHGAVVLVLGIAAIAFSEKLPSSVDGVMERFVGATLVALGVYVIVGLLRHGRDFRLRSRWMLVISAARRFGRWAMRRPAPAPVLIEHDHEHDHDAADEHQLDEVLAHEHAHEHAHDRANAAVTAGDRSGFSAAGDGHHHHRHHHRHRHLVTMPDDPFFDYNARTAVGVGVIHGIGAETPTQLLVFIAAAGAGGTGVGIVMLFVFVVGLIVSNTAIALAASFGYLGASKSFPVYAAVSVVTGVFSLVLGSLFLLGQGGVLPAFFNG